MHMENKKMLKTLVKSMFSRNIATLFIILAISIFLLLPMVLVNASDSVLAMIKQNREQVYGKFTDIYYDYNVSAEENELMLNDSYIAGNFYNMSYRSCGVLYIVEQLYIDDNKYNMGYADDTAIDLGSITLLQGRWPQNTNEVAVTKSGLEVLGTDIGLNDTVYISGKEYTITGVVSDYGRLWPKGQKQSENEATDIDIFVCRDEAVDKYSANEFMSYVILFDRNTDIATEVQHNDNFYYNTNGRLGADEALFRVPDGFIIIIFVVCTFLLFSILFLAKKRIEKRYSIFWKLGLSAKRCRLYISIEMLVNALIGNVVGIILGIAGTKLAVSILEKRLGSMIPISYSCQTAFIMAMCDTVIAVVLGNILFGINKRQKQQRLHGHKTKRSGICRLAFLEFYESKNIFITMCFMLAASVSFIYYINQFNISFVEETEYEEVAGKMPVDYDYELYTEPVATTPMNQGDICIVDTYERDGALDATLKEISNLDGIKAAYGYKENNKIYILEEDNVFCDYLDISDYFFDGRYESVDVNGKLNEIVGYEDKTVIRTKVVGYPEEDVLGFSEFVTEGRINIDKLNSGEEIILVVPAYSSYTEVYDDGNIDSILEPVEYDSENAINDTMYHVGDEILLSELKLLSDINGGINEEKIKTDIERTDFKVKIGAIIRCNVGWFEKETAIGSTYKFITTNDGLDKYGIDVTYNRIRIYAEDNADVTLLSNELYSIAADYPRMALEDMTSQLKNYRELNYLVSLMCILLMVLVVMAGGVTMVTQMLSKTKLNNEYYRLYRMNGLHFSDIIYMFFIQILVVTVLGIIIMFPICYLMMWSIGISSPVTFGGIIVSADMLRLICLYLAVSIVVCIVGSAAGVLNYGRR